MVFDKPYNRSDFADFVQNFLPDDFEPIEQKINHRVTFTQDVVKLGESKNLDLAVFEVKHCSTHDARVELS
jgi:hypothetical protein